MKKISQKLQGEYFKKILLLLLTVAMLIAPAAATCNIVIITDPTGKDPNGAAAGSMSFQQNMFQSTFLSSPNDHFAVLSGGEGESIPRLQAIVASTQALKSGATPSHLLQTITEESGSWSEPLHRVLQ